MKERPILFSAPMVRAIRNDALDWHRNGTEARATLNRILGVRA